jgi:hypothetical protein
LNAREDWMSADLQWTRSRLVNYGRWSRSGSGGPATCQSLEGRYRPERLSQEEEEDRRRARTEIDELDALAVWRAIQPIRGFPRALNAVLAGVYVFRMRDESLRRYLHRYHRMSVRSRDLAALVHEAEVAAHNRLARGVWNT